MKPEEKSFLDHFKIPYEKIDSKWWFDLNEFKRRYSHLDETRPSAKSNYDKVMKNLLHDAEARILSIDLEDAHLRLKVKHLRRIARELYVHPEHFNGLRILFPDKSASEILSKFHKKWETLCLARMYKKFRNEYIIHEDDILTTEFQKKFGSNGVVYGFMDAGLCIVSPHDGSYQGIAVEIDEDHDKYDAEREKLRKDYLQASGYEVIRFSPKKVSKYQRVNGRLVKLSDEEYEEEFNRELDKFIHCVSMSLNSKLATYVGKLNEKELMDSIDKNNVNKEFSALVRRPLVRGGFSIPHMHIGKFLDISPKRNYENLIGIFKEHLTENEDYIVFTDYDEELVNKYGIDISVRRQGHIPATTRKSRSTGRPCKIYVTNMVGFSKILVYSNKPKANQAQIMMTKVYEIAMDLYKLYLVRSGSTTDKVVNSSKDTVESIEKEVKRRVVQQVTMYKEQAKDLSEKNERLKQELSASERVLQNTRSEIGDLRRTHDPLMSIANRASDLSDVYALLLLNKDMSKDSRTFRKRLTEKNINLERIMDALRNLDQMYKQHLGVELIPAIEPATDIDSDAEEVPALANMRTCILCNEAKPLDRKNFRPCGRGYRRICSECI